MLLNVVTMCLVPSDTTGIVSSVDLGFSSTTLNHSRLWHGCERRWSGELFDKHSSFFLKPDAVPNPGQCLGLNLVLMRCEVLLSCFVAHIISADQILLLL